jgi:HAD superfamily hydrolase (TIGR01509 family)
MNWPEIVIFDCDGVLVDSEVIALAHTRAALARFGLELGEAQVRELFLGVSAQSMRGIAERKLGAPLPEDFHRELSREILAEFEHGLKGVEGLREAVAKLDAPVCVASSSSMERIRASLRIVGYSELFEPNVFSSSEVARGKPEPDIFLHAARCMGADPKQCLVVEDSLSGVNAALKAGMTVFGFTGGGHAIGAEYGARLSGAGAEILFDDMRELPRHIDERRARAVAQSHAIAGSAHVEKR